MNNLEYITRSVEAFGLSTEQIELLLLKAHLDPHNAVEINRCDYAMYHYFSVILSMATQKLSEGGYTRSWDMEAVKAFYTAICYELGEKNVLFPSASPSLRNKSQLW